MTHPSARPSSQTVLLLPLDDRPPNVEFPLLLAEAADYRMLAPPKAWLGTPWRGGDMDALAAWLREQAPAADALVVALDTLGYGGLVNSRRSTDPVETILARLELLRQLKQAHPDLTILAYSILMRITRGNDAEEEKAYWAEYGARMFRISYLEDKLAMQAGAPREQEELERLRAQVPASVREDYLAGRARNHAVNCAMIEWVAQGIFDYLVIPQDDTVEYGWNIAEGRRLRMLARRHGVADRISVYPGADETDMLLLARYAAHQAGFQPRIWTRYSSARAHQIITAYEDRPMEEMIKAHLGPLGGTLAPSPSAADILLYVNTPAEVQGNGADQYVLLLEDDQLEALPPAVAAAAIRHRSAPHVASTLRELHSVERNVEEFAQSLGRAIQAGQSCAVVDVAYVNGADMALFAALRRHVEPARLLGYGGWNTAGNTLGTVLAHAVIRRIQQTHGASKEALAAHLRFLFLRMVDDALYQGWVRSQVALEILPELGEEPRMGHLGDHAGRVEQEVARRLTDAAAELSAAAFAGRTVSAGANTVQIGALAIDQLFLPWKRLFEVGCRVTLDVASPEAG